MQPLKRFTQCGSLTMLFGAFIVLFGVSSTALTTFGKTNSNPPPTPGPIIKGKECVNHEDCAAIDRTSCVKDPDDFKLRCLCGDDTPPDNGLCPDILKGLRHKCSNDNECEDGMSCQFVNANRTIGVARLMSLKTKICVCDHENGYVEDTNRDICSSADLQSTTNIAMPIFAVFVGVLRHYKFVNIVFN